ncbi:hypothetical protein BDV25DRAFT_107415 [Aspergillus avenaceus]|uniref:Uncharacterized protein n=1 Tax=Aspergillus avenaceus TaxID=36643 RepID=A0A5N6TWL2_ASPAV|nr:hypothetical protein BDV25DRAFT_107415 [Aspergillus avenaceus]
MSKNDVEQKTVKLEQSDSVTAPKPSRLQRWKAHMKKWWWLYLLGFICAVLVTVLPIIYVAIPRYAENYINNYDFDLAGLTITNPRPNAFHVQQYQKFEANMGGGHLSDFNATMHQSKSAQPFAVFAFPRLSFGKTARMEVDQDLEFSCVECFSQVTADAVRNNKSSIYITGKPSLKINSLPTYDLNVHKTMTLPGLDVQEFMQREDAFNVTRLKILNPLSNNGYNINATITFNSTSPFSVEMGTVSLNLTIGDSNLGYVDLPNLFLRNGTSEAVVLGRLDDKLLIRKGLWETSNPDYGKVKITIHGNRCVHDGKDIPYLTSAIRALNATTTINMFDYAPQILDQWKDLLL